MGCAREVLEIRTSAMAANALAYEDFVVLDNKGRHTVLWCCREARHGDDGELASGRAEVM